MATYAIGDVQGCFEPLQRLLDDIRFDPAQDRLWFCGDLVNRGPNSAKTLRFIKKLGKNAIVVLGNHDFHLLAIAHGNLKKLAESTFEDVLKAKDRDELLDWLRQQPLVHYEPALNYLLCHAGIYPWWDLETALSCAQEVHEALKGKNYLDLLHKLYGNDPNNWDPALKGMERLRFIINCFTRMRYCYLDRSLNLKNKGPLRDPHEGMYPWFEMKDRIELPTRILFGHWASLECNVHVPNIFALDSGCVWGSALTALRLEDQRRFSVSCD
jgi:bis(5'-nucleosyl)-tetraphosphatase (symmetrical)